MIRESMTAQAQSLLYYPSHCLEELYKSVYSSG